MSFLLRLKKYIKTSLNNQQRRNIRKFINLRFRGIQSFIYRILFGSNLRTLALVYGTDKWDSHWYSQHYETHFRPLRRKKLRLLEIGIGGFKDPELGGESLRMWRTYFPKARIFGIDLYDKSLHNERRIRTFKGSQVDDYFLESVIKSIGTIDIVIDDGSHMNEHVLHTFNYLFPKISENGIYVIEDVQTSYWRRNGGSSTNLNGSDTTMGFMKQLIDGLNYAEYEKEDYKPTYFDKHIVAIYFYHNIVFIQKGLNDEGSNWAIPKN